MRQNYRVSVNGMSREFATREEAMDAAREYERQCDPDTTSIKVYDSFNHTVWQN